MAIHHLYILAYPVECRRGLVVCYQHALGEE